MSNLYDENYDELVDRINIEPNQDFSVQPSLKSLVSSTRYLNHKVHKYKSEKERIKQLEHDVYDDNGHINTGSITLHEGSVIDYEITEETDPKSLVPKQYVDDHMNIDVNETLHLKNSNVSLETDGTIIVHKDTNGIISSGNIIIQDSNDDEVIKLSNDGNIKAQNIEINGGQIQNYPINDKDITNKKFVVDYVDSKLSTEYLSKIDTNLQTVEGPINFEGTLTINNGSIESDPSEEKDIVNKKYVDNKIDEDTLLKNKTDEQIVNGPVNFNNTTKIAILSLPVVE